MRTLPRPVSLVLAVSLLIAAPLALTGCSQIVNQVTGGAVDLPGNTVPDDFPSDVPLVDGTVVLGGAIGDDTGKVWNVAIEVPGIEAYDDIDAQLTDAGFASQGVADQDGGKAGTFTKDPYVVVLVVGPGDDNTWIANYTVTESAP